VIRLLRPLLGSPLIYRGFGDLIGAHRARSRFVSEFIRANPGDRVLDIGCGPGILFPYLAQTEYVGFDVSPEYVEAARARFGSRARFVCERVSEHVVREMASFDVAIASGVLHHLDDAEAATLMRVAHASLRPGGRLFTFDGCYTTPQGPVARYILSRDRGQHVRTRDGYVRLASSVFPEVQATVRTDLLRIPYTHVILECVKPGD
jgi:SAM-dependent methyltransferase